MKEIKLTQGMVALVDDSDFEWLYQWKWHYHKGPQARTGYAQRVEIRNGKRYIIYMHRLIMNTPPGQEVDHKDRNGCHNWRENMRNCTHAENSENQSKQIIASSKYKWVFWHKASNKWTANIGVNGRLFFLGTFRSDIAAAIAYNRAARKYFGGFANLNNIDEANINIDEFKCTRPHSSRFKGVSWHKAKSKWRAQIWVKGRFIHLGLFTDEMDAARAYDNAMFKYKGNAPH
jgi:hypothetical protein